MYDELSACETKESGVDVMLSDASLASPAQGLGSLIATALINIEGNDDIFARFICFPSTSEGIVDLAERPPQAKRSRDHQVCTQCCIRSLEPF